ncbi:MAG: hypothetical protein ABR570_16795 [Burkholderiales bacterium]
MLGRSLREALWAPALVVLAAFAIGRLPAADELWWLVHVAGGAALAHCYWRATPILGDLRPIGRYIVAFAGACSTALAWELAEFALDQWLGTVLQEGSVDTMSDLMLGVSGAAAYLACRALSASKAKAGR